MDPATAGAAAPGSPEMTVLPQDRSLARSWCAANSGVPDYYTHSAKVFAYWTSARACMALRRSSGSGSGTADCPARRRDTAMLACSDTCRAPSNDIASAREQHLELRMQIIYTICIATAKDQLGSRNKNTIVNRIGPRGKGQTR